MARWSTGSGASPTNSMAEALPGAAVPVEGASPRRPAFLSPAARKALRHRMLRVRDASIARLGLLSGTPVAELWQYRKELADSATTDVLIQRGAHLAYTQELPHGPLLYLLVRGMRPRRVVETGIRPGYSTAWILAALEANGMGELYSIGPGSPEGRVRGVGTASVGQLVAPAWRTRWTLVLGNTERRLAEVLAAGSGTDVFFYDNGTNPVRARSEFLAAWGSLTPRGVLIAHRVDGNPTWSEFCARQGLAAQVVDNGPPALGGLAVRAVDLTRVGA